MHLLLQEFTLSIDKIMAVTDDGGVHSLQLSIVEFSINGSIFFGPNLETHAIETLPDTVLHLSRKPIPFHDGFCNLSEVQQIIFFIGVRE